MPFRKIKAGLVNSDIEQFVGEEGNLFFDIETGILRLSNGVDPGGVIVSGGSGGSGNYTLPTATTTVKGGVKIDGTTIAIDSQVISVGTVPYAKISGAPTVPTNVSQLTNDTGFITGVSWTQVTGKPTLFSGAYADLTGKPTNVSSFTNDSGYLTSSSLSSYATQTYVTSRGYITSASLPTSVSDLTNDSGYLTENEFDLNTIDLDVNNKLHATGILPGDAEGFTAVFAGRAAGVAALPNTVIQSQAEVNDYAQNNFQNTYDGNHASTEWVATSPNGDDSNYYIDLGICGASWDGTAANSLYTNAGQRDGWLYVQGGNAGGGNLILGTSLANTYTKIIAGNAATGDREVARFSSTEVKLKKQLTFNDNTTQTTAWTGTVDWADVTNTPTIITTLGSLDDVLTAGATDGQVLKYNATAGKWQPAADLVGSGGSGIGLTDLSASNNSASGGGSLSYSNTTGVFTFTPPDLSTYVTTSSLSSTLTSYATTSYVTSQGYITSAGNAATATRLGTARTINSVSFDGSASITVTANTTNALTIGTGLSGTSFDGSTAVTVAVDSTIARRADTTYVGTTSIALNRTSSSQTLTGVNIDGNAATVTDGVYTTGTYSNPAWITSLAYSKLTGTPTLFSGAYADLTGKPTLYSSAYIGTTNLDFTRASGSQTLTGISIDGNAATVTNGLYSTSSYANPSWLTSLAYSKLTGAPSVPVNVSQLTNDSGYITAAAIPPSFTFNVTADDSTLVAIGTEETIKFLGGTGIDTIVDAEGMVTISIDTTVATLTGSQTLTNKTLTLPTIGGTGATFNGSTSGTTVLRASSTAGTTTVTLPATTGTVVTTGDTGTVTNTMLAGSIANAKLFNSTVTIGSTVVALGTTTANLEGLNSVTATNFIGNATTVTNGVYTNSIGAVTDIMLAGSIANNKLTNSSITVNGTSISLGSSATIKASTTNALTIGTGLSGTSFDGGSAVTIALATGYGDTQNPYASKTANYFLAAPNGSSGAPTFRAIVAADIPTLNQNTTGSAATLTTSRNINGVAFNGSADITVTAAAGTLTGTTLNSTVVTSSLTSVGTLNGLTVSKSTSGTALSITASNAAPYGGTATWQFVGNGNIGGVGSWIQFPDSTLQTTAYTGNAATVTNGVYTTDTGTVTNTMLAGSIANNKLANSSITVNGTSISLGSSATVTAAASTLTGTTLNSTVVTSSLTSVGTLTGLAVTTTATGNAVNVTYTPPSATGAAYFATGKDTAGGTGYFDFLRATNTTSGVTNATKTFRVNSIGTLEILNSAYNATILSVTDAGFIAINASTGSTNGVPINNGIAMNANSYIYDDGNYHITAKTGNIWLNSNNGGAVSINQQVPSGTAAGGLAVTGPVNAQTGYYARTPWNSAIDTEITVDDYRFRISNQGGIFPQVISNTSGTKNSAWTVVAARSGSAITQTGSTGTLVANNTWTSLYTSGGMDSAGDTFVATLQDKSQGRIYRVTFMRSDNGSTTGYNIIAERLL